MLERLGRWEEAVAAQRAAQARGPGNANHAINLGACLTRLDRPREALAALEGLANLSPFGRMQAERVRLQAALATGDEAGRRRALDTLREQERESPAGLVHALAVAGEADEAARRLVALLADEGQRHRALRLVQGYAEGGDPPRQAEWEGRLRAVVARPEVQAAVAAVGRIERVRLRRP